MAGSTYADIGDTAARPHFLQRIAERRPVARRGRHATYLAHLDRCLIERAGSRTESDRLVELAAELGIERAKVDGLNRRYFAALVAIAWEDGVLTTGERADLATVAALLRVPPADFEAAISAPPAG